MANTHPKLKVRMNRAVVYSWVIRNDMRMQDLAHSLGIPPAYLSQFLHGRRYPGPQRRKQILKVMRPLKWSDLFEEVVH